MAIDDWNEIKTAFHVAKLGTVSAAAEALGVHHATVIRHVDALEARLGAKLFQRHARGYTATEAGQDLLQVAHATQDQFGQLSSRIKGRGNTVTGDLVVTSLSVMSPLLAPVLAQFQSDHPRVTVRLLTDNRLFRLEYGEAHVAIRAGAAPQEPDNVVQAFIRQSVALYASKAYVARYGKPTSEAEFTGHRFVALDDETTRVPSQRWLWHSIPKDRIVYRTSSNINVADAVRAGAGIGFVPVFQGGADPALVQILPPRDIWAAPVWLVTHVDLHRTAKVQTFLSFLKEKAKDWPDAV